ncbi:hypothetical protein MSG28_012604, partial [Choristoneura fumiferana]
MLPENWDTGADDIVLSGLSGRLPESNNIEEFAKNLFDGVDLVTADDRRWPPGPSYAIDSACSSSAYAIAQAVADLHAGKCDAAIVAGANICLLPGSSLHVHRLDMLSPVGRCAAFDADGRGYVRSEAAVTVLLQRRRDCRRLYCTVRGVRTNSDGYKVQGITYPTGAMQRQLAQETFEEARLRPQDVAYVEAHGTGTKVGDPEEVNAIDELFCESRATPLLIGSVKSNMGHAEAASGLCSIAKVVVAMEHGVIPGNLHYRTPNPDIPALSDGRIKVVDRNTPWQGGLVAVNSFGFGGANAHVILESQGGERPPPASYPAPRLVLASGRTEAAVERLLRLAVDHPRDAELHALLDAVHARAIPRHIYRGYSVLNPEHDEPSVLETMKMELTETRPVWFVFTGMGSQWHGMARALMRLPVFAASIARLAVALRPLGFDLPYVLTEAPEANFDAVVNSMVSITAVQVALVDVLREVGVRPNGIVGFSVGENAEQAVLCTYWRARCIVDAALPPGAMAAVGLTWEETARRCPPDVFPACHNSANNVTVSGPSDSVEQLVAELKTEGVFVRSVNSTGIAFHSKYIAAAVPQLRTKLQEIIPEPRPRSLHWISTSLGPDQQDSEWGKLCGAEYHVNNVVSPVRFADALRAIPEHAIVVEVAPHALLNAVLRRALPSATHVPLVRRNHPEPLSHLLQALGRLFTAGAQPRVSSLYPPVSWPVSRGTPMLASAIEWDHSKEWTVANYKLTTHTGENVIEFDLGKPDQAFLDGHNIDGRVLFPGAGYLTMVWRTVAKVNNLNMNEIAVLLEDIHFRRATIMSRDVPLRFLVTLLSNSGNFEICEGGAVVATGRARLVTDPAAERLPVAALADDASVEDIPSLDAHDVYKELHLRGYNYQGVFRGVLQSNANVTEGLLAWENNWISFIDSMLQFEVIAENTRVLKMPTRIQRVLIDPAAQKAAEAAATSGGNLPIRRFKDLSVTVAGGVELRGIKNSLAPRRTNALIAPKLEKYEFTPLDTTRVDTVDVSLLKGSALTVALQLVLENSNTLRLKVAEVALGRPASDLLLPLVLPILDAEPQVRVDASLAAGANAVNYAATVEPLGVKLSNKEWLDDMDFKCQLVLATNVLEQHDASVLRKLTAMLDARGHLLLEEPANALDKPGAASLLEDAHLVTVARQGAAACEYVLLRRIATRPATRIILEVRDDDFAWLETLRDAMKRATSEELLVYVWSRDAGSGVLGLGTCLRREAGGDKLRVYYLPGAKDDFDPDAPALYAQVQLDLTFNVLRAGIWGTYRHFLLDDPANMQLQVEHAYADILTRGDLSSLSWIQSDLQYATSAPQAAHSNLCHVYYAPLNFRDIMVATGKLPPDSLPGNLAGQECILGLEFSGRLSSGKRVMGMVAAKGLATTVVADEGFMWDVPAAWSLKEAATVPVAYATAYYALVVRGSMKRGDSVLVHAGAGGVGQAAISIALHAGCTVYTTVGSPAKRAFLRERYPTLPDTHIGNSRDCSFEQLVLKRTCGRGVDMVLNSLAGDQLQASLRCLAEGGRFLEIGKVDLSAGSLLSMAVLLKNTTVHGILLDALFGASQYHHEKVAVMRYMATGKHIGKVLIRIREEESGGHSPPPRLLPALPRTYMHPAKSYVLVGGLGGFGLELCDWLVKQGARALVLNSRSGHAGEGLMARVTMDLPIALWSGYASRGKPIVCPRWLCNGAPLETLGSCHRDERCSDIVLADTVPQGLSGRLPESNNIEEFAKNLFDGVDLVTADDRRWPPDELRGSRTGVYVGISGSETGAIWSYDEDKINGYALTGCASSMLPNRLSYTFDFKGPSYAIDSACSSSAYALAQAVADLHAGKCDAAIVAGANICLLPGSSLHVHRLDMLSPVGRCAAFDADGRGYVRSEAAVTVLLQRRRDCRRLYCTVRGVRTNSDGYKVQGITYPTGAMQRQLAQETFEEARLRPQDVAYVEAHGTGTKVGDPEEVNAIDELFCESRATPLLIGSVKSNMGHAEATSGLCSIAKVVVAMEHGVIPGNLHYRTPNPDIPALSDGRIKVVDRNTPWQGGLVAVNSFGFGGANAHVILESQGGERPPPASYPAPRLVLASGRTEAAVERLLRLAVDHPRDAELHALLDAVHARAIPRHIYRGYSVLNPEHDEPSVLETMKMELTETRPVWFVFTGMGSQWHGMARALMRLPVFAASIARLAVALRPLGFDLPYVLTEAPEANFDAVVNSMVSITAVQVALVDVLREVGVRPNGIVGFSVGENGDRTSSALHVLARALYSGRGAAPGAMAAVGLTWEETARRCPPDVFPACHNSANNVTVSGPSDSVEQLVAELKTEGVFVRSVNSTGIAFHSKYIAAAVPQLRTKLQEIIPEPRPRSLHWISTSLGPDQQDSEWGKLCGAEYHVNNILSPVRFADALRAIPEHAIVVEVAPHALLNAVLRRALPSATHVPLVRRNHPEPLSHLLQALGRLFTAGAQPRVSSLYPPVSWPVSRGTPMLASAIEWDHSKEWTVANYKLTTHTGENVIEFDLGKPDQAFLDGHNIDGRVLFPGAGYLTMVWRTVAKVNNLNMNEIAVLLEDIHFRRATIMSRDVPLRFLVTLLSNSGNFEICEGGAVVATGRARLVTDPAAERLPVAALADDAPVEDIPSLDAHDVYKELHLRGYNYQGVFRGVLQSNAIGTEGLLAWENNWISFIDSMLQFQIIAENTRVLKLPTRIQRVLIDPAAHKAAEAAATSGGNLPIRRYKDLSVTVAGGVELRGIKNSLAPRRTNALIAPKLEKYEFTPLDTTRVDTVDVSLLKGSALTVALQLVLENSNTLRLKVAEVALGRPASDLLLPLVLPILDAEPQVRVDASLAAGANAVNYAATVEPLGVKLSNKEWLDDMDFKCQLVLATNVLEQHDASVLRKLTAMLDARGHLLLEEPANALDKPGAASLLEDAHLVTVARQGAAACEYVLLRRIATRSGVLGLGTCLRREAGGDKLRVYYLPGAKDDFDPDAPALYAQVQLDLTFNVLRAGIWGTYRHFLLDDPANMQLQVEHAYADILTRGDLSSLSWIQSDLQYATSAPQAAHSNLCHVYYAPLNFRDIMVATGKLPPDSLPGNLAGQECILGLEFSGRLSSGKRVMGMVAAKGLATTVVADEGFMWDVPAAWSLKEAATVPVAYATAYYALVVRGSMKRGDSVLVHAGAGGVGQAAISIALHAGCTVYTTVGSPAKRAFLRERYPTLPDTHIGNSRDCSFEQLVLKRTCGRGVDMVLNSLAGDQLQASLRCLAEGGRFLEIGKVDLSAGSLLSMAVLLKNTTVHGILLDALFGARQYHHEKVAVMRCVSEGIVNGAVRPLPAVEYADYQLEQAFRYMATGKHIGKVLIRIREEESGGHLPPPRLLPALPHTYMHPAKSYVLVGEWREKGVQVNLSTSDVTTVAGARTLLGEAARAAPVGGIFNLAAVWHDAFLENQTPENFLAVTKPKIDACGRGTHGQSNYGLANSAMERLCEQRQADSLPALAVQWGAIGDVGIVATVTKGVSDIVLADTVPQGIASCLNTLDALMTLPHAVTAAMVVADKRPPKKPSQEIVQVVANILGLSGRLPESNNIEEFAKNLFDGVDLVTADDRRWPPDELRGSRTGVYVGISGSETGAIWSYDEDKINGYAVTGCALSMLPNRLSYTFDFKGPSYAIDSACSSSAYAIAQAVADLHAGKCDAAIVAGANICLFPGSSLHVHRLDMLSPVGRCAAFDADGRGYVRSEAAVTVLLQRRRDCRRLYCTVRGVRTNSDGYKVQGITYPTGAMQRQLAQETFEEARLRPQDVAYVEAHGTGTKVGDPEEVNAIDELFCESRATPLLIGSVKSNMGHAEAASGLCSIAKVVVAMEHGVIPGNLHYRTPNPDIPALSDGRIKVVDRNTPWQGGLVAVNSFGFGGANAHVILESQGGERPPPASYPAPRLVLASGRTEAAVERLLRLAVDHPRDAELHALLDAVHARAIPRHIYRGYSVLNPEHDEPSVLETMKMELTETRPVWFVFTGMGSQWHGMARALMRLPVFAASIARLAVALRPLGFDLPYVLTEAPEANFDAVVNSMVSITAVQVALVDVLREVGVRPNGIVGFSVGENAEQAVLCTYWRARCIVDAALPPGAMAAVGLTWEETARRCPPDVFPACHNSADNVTVSGPSDSVEQLVAELKTEGVFVRSVNSTGIAFHSKYIAAAVPQLRTKLQEIIPEPRPRSLHWISTSLGPDQQDSEWGKLCGAEYHVNNVVSPVRFADALRAIPEDAIVVEVAPHALLNAVLRRALPSATHVPLVRRDHPEPLSHLLQALGRLFTAGAQPRVSSLYPPVSWPVSRGTPMLASAIEWDHSKEWTVANYKLTTHTGENVIEFDLGKPDQAFLDGHNIDGRVLFPGAGYLTMVWRTVAKVNNLNMNEIAVLLEDIHFRRATIMSRDVPLRFLVTLLSNSGNFEICEGGAVVATGRARLVTDPAAERLPVAALADDAPVEDIPSLDAHDVYKELHLRGYNYQGVFCGVLQSNANVTEGLLAWENNWISFIDSMLQFQIIAENTRVLKLPTRIQRVLIDPAAQKAAEAAATSGGNLPIRRYKDLSVTVAGGVELRGIKNSLAPRRTNALIAPKLEKYEFTPLDTTRVDTVDVSLLKGSALTVALQLVLENSNTLRLKVAEVALGRPASELLLPLVLPILDAEPQVRVDASLAAGANAVNYAATVEPLGVKLSNKEWLDDMDFKCQLVLATNVLEQHDASVLRKLTAMLDAHGHLLLEAPANALDKPGAAALLEDAHLVTVARQGAAACEYVLLRRVATRPATRIILEVRDDDFAWVETLGDAMKRATSEELRVYVWSRDAGSGVLGLGTCLRREAGGDKLRVYYLPGAKDDFDPDAPALYAQVQLDLTFNVLRAGIWGTYRHFLLDDPANMQLQVEHAHADILTRGDLSSLRWIQSDLQYATSAPQAAHSNLCHVYYAPLNFRDIMVATGKLSPDSLPGNLAGQECILGLEFSGRLSSGKRVMGMVAAKGLATTVVADEGFMWDVPAAWSLKEAATVPVAYATAYYALAVRGSMKRGDSVLVHAGAGGVGQAAISIALHAGCTVYTTVGSPAKRAFLRERYPTLPDTHIGNSRDCSFEQLVLKRTCGRGVDMVLNSLAGDQLQASLRCLAEGGRFLEIGKVDLSAGSLLSMAVLLKNTTVHGILLDALFGARQYHHEKVAVMRCVSEGIVNGAVRPLPAVEYADYQLEQAFRYMATGKHIGKVLIRIREEESGGHSPPPRLLPALPRTYMHPAKSYVLVGGLGGFGLELCDWLVKQDVTTVAGARTLLGEAARAAPVGGIFNLAAVWHDAFLENQTPENFLAVTKPKIDACGRGTHGQSNYGLANSAMERLCEQRQADSLPALAVQWGAIGDVGIVATVTKGVSDIVLADTVPQGIASCLNTLDALMTLPHAVTAAMVVADKRPPKKPSQEIVQVVANILGKLCGAEYHVNNVVSPVRSADALRAIPEDAIVVEVAPHALLNAVLRRALPSATHVPLVRRDHPEPLSHLLQALGRLFTAGAQPRVSSLYPAVSWPVSRGTPMLASAIEWDHSKEWTVANYKLTTHTGENVIEFDLGKPDQAFLDGHNIDGRVLFPGAGYLTMVWRTVAKVNNLNMNEIAVLLEDIHFRRATIMSRDVPLRFLVTLLSNSGNFEICEGGAVVATGRARLVTDPAAEHLPVAALADNASVEDIPSLDAHDVYKELHLRGYNYQGVFRGVLQSNAIGTEGLLAWENNWISFIDS